MIMQNIQKRKKIHPFHKKYYSFFCCQRRILILMRSPVISLFFFLLLQGRTNAQALQEHKDSLVLSNSQVTVTVNTATGKLSYRFSNGIHLDNTVAYVDDIHSGRLST